MRKFFIVLTGLCLSVSLFAQEQQQNYKGVVVDREKKPLDVVSVVVFNDRDTTEQIYANTFPGGQFDITLQKKNGNKYSAYFLSVGYRDLYVELDKLGDTVVMRNNSVHLDDVVVKGKRDVSTSLGVSGGILYDVSNTYLSDLGSSTQLLSFIPGVRAEDDGTVSILGTQGDVEIYINNRKMQDKDKLLSIKSEDIKSVEVLRSPGARYKGASAVILIRTSRPLDGFSSMVSAEYSQYNKKDNYFTPKAEFEFKKDKITLSAAYRYSQNKSSTTTLNDRNIDNSLVPGNWAFKENSVVNNKYGNHWYTASIDYQINEKNTVNLEYSGNVNDSDNDGVNDQGVYSGDNRMFLNKLSNSQKDNVLGNRVHLYYRGDFSPKFNMEFNADYSHRKTKNDIFNRWEESGDSGSSTQEFNQISDRKSSAVTAELLFTNVLGDRHTLNYGVEYSYLMDDNNNRIVPLQPGMTDTRYKLNSHYLTTITEYKVRIGDMWNLSMGANYMYNRLESTSSTQNFHNVKPYLSVMYYNPEKNLGVNASFNYDVVQPDAGMLDDMTETYISPYEKKVGNSSLKNMSYFSGFVVVTIKKVAVGAMYMYSGNAIMDYSTVSDNGGKPLITSKPINITKPLNQVGLLASYSNQIGFWSPNINIMGFYTRIEAQYLENDTYVNDGFMGALWFANNFKLPKNFSINLNFYGMTPSITGTGKSNGYYALNMSVEKRFLDDKLRVSLYGNGLLANKKNITTSRAYGIIGNDEVFRSSYRSVGINVSWRFNNYRKVQEKKDNKYLEML